MMAKPIRALRIALSNDSVFNKLHKVVVSSPENLSALL